MLGVSWPSHPLNHLPPRKPWILYACVGGTRCHGNSHPFTHPRWPLRQAKGEGEMPVLSLYSADLVTNGKNRAIGRGGESCSRDGAAALLLRVSGRPLGRRRGRRRSPGVQSERDGAICEKGSEEDYRSQRAPRGLIVSFDG